MRVNKGDIIYLKEARAIHGSIQGMLRPYVVVSNDIGNFHSDICLVCPLTRTIKKLNQPTHAVISYHNSMVCCEQIHTLLQDDVSEIVWHVSDRDLNLINECLKASLGLKGSDLRAVI